MLKKLLLVIMALFISMSAAFAAVDVNTADQATLEGVKGIGPVISKAIIAERAKSGPFKNADDLADRVKGIGAKSVVKLEQQGLTINGSSAPPSATRTTPKSTATTATTAATATTGAETPAAKPTRSKRAKKADAATTGAATGATAAAPATASQPAAASAAKGKKLSKRAAAKAAKAAAASQ